MQTIDNVWQRVVQRMTTSDTEWQRMATNVIEWLFQIIFLLFRIREGPTTKYPKENSLSLEKDHEQGLLNQEQKRAPKKKY